MKANFLSEIKDAQIEYRTNQPLDSYSTWQIGGLAKVVLWPKNTVELATILTKAAQSIPLIGQGSNILFSDDGLEWAICLKNMREILWGDNAVTVAAGVPLSLLAKQAAERGFSDLAALGGIPGSIGGAVVMNAGCFGSEISELVETVECLSKDGEIIELKKEQCDFSYRKSLFSDNELIVSKVKLVFKKSAEPMQVLQLMDDYRQRRLLTQPYEYPNCGSVFKNPPNESAGRLIEQAGLKGYRVGGAQVSEKHANFIVNRGAANAADVCTVIKYIRRVIQEKYNINLQTEVKFMGFANDPLK